MLTVPEAARLLRIGRTLAYRLATEFLDGGEGLPVVRLGGVLRVPREALRPMLSIDGPLPAIGAAAEAPSPRAVRKRQVRQTAQLTVVPLPLAFEG